MVLPNYPLQGVSRAGALTEALPMSWFYERMSRESNLLQEISGGPVATATGGS